MSRNIIYCAFASLDGFNGSENMSGQKDALSIYLKNACVSCYSAKKHNPDADVAFVHNLTRIPDEFKVFFNKYNILDIYLEFNSFIFPPNYRWSLAFYKLCALKYFTFNTEYNKIISLDVDTFSIGGLTPCLEVMEDRLVLYNVQHSYNLDAYQRRLEEYHKLYNSNSIPTVYGGEFIGGKKSDLKEFVLNCEKVYHLLNRNNFETKFGDEFITFCAAEEYKGKIADAAPYIRRYWTTDLYYQCFTDHNLELRVLHVPNEKNNAFLRIYNYIKKYGKLPKNKKTFKMFGLPRVRRPKYYCNFIYQVKRKIIKLFGSK